MRLSFGSGFSSGSYKILRCIRNIKRKLSPREKCIALFHTAAVRKRKNQGSRIVNDFSLPTKRKKQRLGDSLHFTLAYARKTEKFVEHILPVTSRRQVSSIASLKLTCRESLSGLRVLSRLPLARYQAPVHPFAEACRWNSMHPGSLSYYLRLDFFFETFFFFLMLDFANLPCKSKKDN